MDVLKFFATYIIIGVAVYILMKKIHKLSNKNYSETDLDSLFIAIIIFWPTVVAGNIGKILIMIGVFIRRIIDKIFD